MWTISVSTDEYERRHRRFEKKRWTELEAVHLNLATYHSALNAGSKPVQIPKMHSFVHPEPRGIYAIAEAKKKSRRNLAQTRLYVYPDSDRSVLHLLTIGDKDTQKEDIEFCKDCVDELELRKREAATDEPEPDENATSSTET